MPKNTSIINSVNIQKPSLPPQQRRLNSKNSIGNLLPSQDKVIRHKGNFIPTHETSMRVNYDNEFQSFLQ